MKVSENTLKTALKAGQVQHGLWLAAASPIVTEIAGAAGFDWCLIDGEHGPNTITDMLPQLQALAGTGTPAVMRLPSAEVWMVKQALDLGVQTIVIPMVDDAAKAEEMARAMRYPPDGIRGMGAVLSRASGYNAIAEYVHQANAEVCLFVQAESRAALDDIDAIAAIDGVDGIFVGPADLSADMGFVGQLHHPEVLEAIDHIIARTVAAGKLAGIITDESQFERVIKQGVTFLGVGGDTMLMQSAFSRLAAGVKGA